MYKIVHQNSKAIILLHEIYGVNQHILDKAHEFSRLDFDVYCPDMYGDGSVYDYAESDMAYNRFTNSIGVERASENLLQELEQISSDYESSILIGFSIGASVAWLLSQCPYFVKIICIYGSRIRDYLSVVPIADVSLCFAKEEKSFEPRALAEKLNKIESINDIYLLDGTHGFADPYSSNYNSESAGKLMEIIKNLISS